MMETEIEKKGVVNFEVSASSHSIKMLRKELQQSSISQID